MHLIENKPLAPLTTLGVGGPARYFLEAHSKEDILESAEWVQQRSIPIFVLGGGSNLVVSDKGFSGLVLHIALQGIETVGSIGSDQLLFRAAAGENWDHFVQQAVTANCAGIECLAGIPGTVGGTPVQNVGAYGQEVSTVIKRVRAFDLHKHAFMEFSAAECEFAYRRSRFNSREKGRYIVTHVDFSLQRAGTPMLKYADLQRAFAAGAEPTLAEVAAAVRRIRESKGMLLIEGDADCHSAGSFFKNPIVPIRAVATIAATIGTPPPTYDAGPNERKISAAWLIEHAGFAKGYTRGAAGISTRHTLALVNRGGATAAEILALAEEIRAAVAFRFGVILEMEPVLVGF